MGLLVMHENNGSLLYHVFFINKEALCCDVLSDFLPMLDIDFC